VTRSHVLVYFLPVYGHDMLDAGDLQPGSAKESHSPDSPRDHLASPTVAWGLVWGGTICSLAMMCGHVLLSHGPSKWPSEGNRRTGFLGTVEVCSQDFLFPGAFWGLCPLPTYGKCKTAFGQLEDAPALP
jgi:hypothetical protein